MEQIELYAEVRTVLGKQVRRLRREGWVPAVLYGPNTESRPLQIAAREAKVALAQAGSSQLLTIHVTGEKPIQVLIRDFQRDAIRRDLLHLDLYQVDMTQEVTVEVPLVLVGVSPPVEQREGLLLQNMESIEVACLPTDLIDALEVDISDLAEVNQQFTVGDLAIPANIRVLSNSEEIVIQVSPIQEIPEEELEEEELELIPEGEVEPEVIERGKAEKEEEDK